LKVVWREETLSGRVDQPGDGSLLNPKRNDHRTAKVESSPAATVRDEEAEEQGVFRDGVDVHQWVHEY
jgi:hypothetical protein